MPDVKDMLAALAADHAQEDDDLVGQAAGAGVAWKPDDDTISTAIQYGFASGVNPFHRLKSPAGRNIGFPFPSARQHQLEGVDAILDEMNKGNDVLFEAPVGAGKSPIEIGVASQCQTTYMLIGRNDLVDQWERDFDHFKDIGFLKARHRFDCTTIKDNYGNPMNCSQAKDSCGNKRKNSPEGTCPKCPYAVNRDMALSKPHTVMTLTLGLTIFTHLASHPAVTKRDLLIVDECSELESEIMRFYEYQIASKTIFQAIDPHILMSSMIPDPSDPFYGRWPQVKPEDSFYKAFLKMRPEQTLQHCALWAIEMGYLAQQRAMILDGHRNGTNDMIDEIDKAIKHCGQIVAMTQNMITCMEAEVPYHAIVEDSPEAADHYTVRVAPLEARGMIGRLLAPYADRLLFVSATTGTAEMFKAAHAYDRPLVRIELPSTFPVANRPVYSLRSGSMTAKNIDRDAPKVMQAVVQIANYQSDNERFNHCTQKGIVHTYNNKITNMVIEALEKGGVVRRDIYRLTGGGKQRAETLEQFRRHQGRAILVSPSAMLGLSMNDDLARWQCIAKMPYAFLGEPSVAHRKDRIDGWYDWQTAKDLMQTFGRVVRSETDWGITYILDDAFSWFYAKQQHLFPHFVREAIWQKD